MPPMLGGLRMKKDEAEYHRLKMNAGLRNDPTRDDGKAARRGYPGTLFVEGSCTCILDCRRRPELSVPASFPSDRVIEEGDAIVIDIGGRKSGFPSDISRMAVIGLPAEGHDEIYAIVERAVEAALKAAKPGVPAKEVDFAAREVISDPGYGDYFVHHGMGIDGHESPYITATSETILEKDMVFSSEPGIYLPGRFGVRLEDIVILRAHGPEILSSNAATGSSR